MLFLISLLSSIAMEVKDLFSQRTQNNNLSFEGRCADSIYLLAITAKNLL